MADRIANTRMQRLNALRAAVNTKCGARTMDMADRMLPKVVPRLSTGSLSFDFVLGGGIPVGHISIFRGAESSGKTTNALRVVGLAQGLCANCYRRPPGGVRVEEVDDSETGEVTIAGVAECDCVRTGAYVPMQFNKETDAAFRERMKRYQENSYEEFRVVYLDVEGALDLPWAQRLGCDPARMMVVRTATCEEAIDMHDELARTGSVDLIVLDSLAAMTPSEEVEKSAEEWQRGLHARLLNKWCRKTTAARHSVRSDFDRPVTEIWINQERKVMDISFGDNTIMPGGEGQKFTASVVVKMWASQWEKATVDDDLKKEYQIERGTDVRMNVKVTKNKTAPAQGQGGYRMGVAGDRAGQVLDVDYLLVQAERYGIFGKEDKGWRLGDEKYRTKAEVIKRVEEPAVRHALRATLVARMLGVA